MTKIILTQFNHWITYTIVHQLGAHSRLIQAYARRGGPMGALPDSINLEQINTSYIAKLLHIIMYFYTKCIILLEERRLMLCKYRLLRNRLLAERGLMLCKYRLLRNTS